MRVDAPLQILYTQSLSVGEQVALPTWDNQGFQVEAFAVSENRVLLRVDNLRETPRALDVTAFLRQFEGSATYSLVNHTGTMSTAEVSARKIKWKTRGGEQRERAPSVPQDFAPFELKTFLIEIRSEEAFLQ